MARIAPSGVIATSAAWLALILVAFRVPGHRATARSAMVWVSKVEAGLHDHRFGACRRHSRSDAP